MQNVEKLYGELANLLNDRIPTKWDKIWFYTEIDELETSCRFYFIESESKEVIDSGIVQKRFNLDLEEYFTFIDELNDLAEKINSLMAEEYSNIWTTMTLILDSSWDFETDFTYESLDDTDRMDRRTEWNNKYLKDYPQYLASVTN